MGSKICFKCGIEKPLDDFYKHSKMSDGRLNKCKECTKNDVHKYRSENIEKVREYDRSRGELPHRVAARNEYQKTDAYKESSKKAKKKYAEKNKAKLSELNKKWASENKKKRKAHGFVSYAVRIGKLTSMRCEVCGCEKTIAHHDDYNEPLKVRWLCSKHHREWHSKNGEGRNGHYTEDELKAMELA